MPDEPPTDHRAEAEAWLATAVGHGDQYSGEPCIAAALIGIGHALLANLGSNRPYDFEMIDPAWDRCHWWTDGDNWAYTGQAHWTTSPSWPARRRCVLYADHEGEHSDPPDPREQRA